MWMMELRWEFTKEKILREKERKHAFEQDKSKIQEKGKKIRFRTRQK